MTIPQSNLLELARKGDAGAIATLMNQKLKPRGINVDATLENNCLQITLEAAQVPDQESFVALICKGIASLKASSIRMLEIQGRQVEKSEPTWKQRIDLQPVQNLGASVQIPSSNETEAPRITSRPLLNKSSNSKTASSGNDSPERRRIVLSKNASATDLKYLSATKLGKHFNLSTNQVNPFLEDLGFLEKVPNGWIATEKGLAAGAEQRFDDVKNNQYVVWLPQILHLSQ